MGDSEAGIITLARKLGDSAALKKFKFKFKKKKNCFKILSLFFFWGVLLLGNQGSKLES